MDPQQWSQRQDDLRHAFVEHLIDRVSADTYPSTTMLDLIEQTMGPREQEAYVEVLIGKISQDAYPSIPMIQRLRALL